MARRDMGFDLDGRPLSQSPTEIRALMDQALADPDSDLVLVVLRRHGDLMLHIMGPSSHETLADLEHVLTTAIKAYRRILTDQ